MGDEQPGSQVEDAPPIPPSPLAVEPATSGPTKRCPGCGNDYPATHGYFYRNGSKPDGFQVYCKKCFTNNFKRKGNRPVTPAQTETPKARRSDNSTVADAAKDRPYDPSEVKAFLSGPGSPEPASGDPVRAMYAFTKDELAATLYNLAGVSKDKALGIAELFERGGKRVVEDAARARAQGPGGAADTSFAPIPTGGMVSTFKNRMLGLSADLQELLAMKLMGILPDFQALQDGKGASHFLGGGPTNADELKRAMQEAVGPVNERLRMLEERDRKKDDEDRLDRKLETMKREILDQAGPRRSNGDDAEPPTWMQPFVGWMEQQKFTAAVDREVKQRVGDQDQNQGPKSPWYVMAKEGQEQVKELARTVKDLESQRLMDNISNKFGAIEKRLDEIGGGPGKGGALDPRDPAQFKVVFEGYKDLYQTLKTTLDNPNATSAEKSKAAEMMTAFKDFPGAKEFMQELGKGFGQLLSAGANRLTNPGHADHEQPPHEPAPRSSPPTLTPQGLVDGEGKPVGRTQCPKCGQFLWTNAGVTRIKCAKCGEISEVAPVEPAAGPQGPAAGPQGDQPPNGGTGSGEGGGSLPPDKFNL